MRYHVAPGATGIGGNSWTSVGDLTATLNHVINNPSAAGDEIWAAGDNNVLGAAYQGQYNLTAPLSINGNTAPLSIYGGFAGWENTLCDRDANIISPPTTAIPNFFLHPSILDGGNMNRVIEMDRANVCRIDGFVITQGNSMTGEGGGMNVDASNNIIFENVVIMNNQTGGAEGGGMYIVRTNNVLFRNMIFFNNFAIHGGGGGGLFIDNCNDATFVNVLFNANSADAGNAILMDGCLNLKIINCTIADNVGTGAINAGVYCVNSDVEIYNSIIYPDNLYIEPVAHGNVIVDYCLLSNRILLFPNLNPNGINPPLPPLPPIPPNPNFVNPVPPPIIPPASMGDYHLSNTATLQSQCIDAGDIDLYLTTLDIPPTDLEGKPRFVSIVNPFPDVVDLGAFEVQ